MSIDELFQEQNVVELEKLAETISVELPDGEIVKMTRAEYNELQRLEKNGCGPQFY